MLFFFFTQNNTDGKNQIRHDREQVRERQTKIKTTKLEVYKSIGHFNSRPSCQCMMISKRNYEQIVSPVVCILRRSPMALVWKEEPRDGGRRFPKRLDYFGDATTLLANIASLGTAKSNSGFPKLWSRSQSILCGSFLQDYAFS